MILLDGGSDLAASMMVASASEWTPGNFTASFVTSCVDNRWSQYFGKPRVVRLDTEGAFRSGAVRDWAQSQGMEVDIVPAEAH